jgi:WD40 repeat protein/serine/threonine protein kinase/tetratricopeptide (TPR) repeat protein
MSASSDARSPVELLADEFLARCKRGEKPTIKEYCDRHPDLADEIRDVFEALLMVEDLKPGSSDVSGSLDESVKAETKRLEQVGNYRILCEIGRGGMGVVYEAEQQALGRRVALKVLPRTSAGDGSAQIRFQREAKAAARMHHTNIVPVFDVGQDGDYLYYAMQLIHGQGLDLVIDDLKRLRAQSKSTAAKEAAAGDRSIAASLVQGRFEQENLLGADSPGERGGGDRTAAYEGSAPSSAVLPGHSELSTVQSNRLAYYRSVAQIGVQTAAALSYAHSRGIIHRDIKPGNLILDTTGNVWVTDFGLAKTGDGGVTHTGDILGTVRYMAPERFRGQCDVRADVYALGMTLYELLTLKAAYASGDRLKLIELIRQAEAASPRSVDGQIPRDLETIVMKAIDKDPRRRYQSADELAEDLQRFVNDEPIKARRIGTMERLGRWCRRNPALATAAGLAALALVGVTLLSVLFGVAQAERAREQSRAHAALSSAYTDLSDQKQQTQEALHKSERLAGDLAVSLNNQQKQSARLALERGQSLIAQQDRAGLLWLVRALELVPADATDLQRIIRLNLADLSREVPLLRVVLSAPNQFQAALFSPDGKLIFTSSDGSGRLWDTATGQPFGPELKTGQPIDPKETPERDLPACFSPDGKTLVTGGGGSVRLWDVATGELLAEKRPITKGVTVMAFSRDGKVVLTVNHKDKTAQLWEVATGKAIGPALAHKAPVGKGTFSPDGKLVATGSIDGARLWEAASGKPVGQPLKHQAWTYGLAFSPDGKTLLTGSWDQSARARLWDAATGKPLGPPLVHPDVVFHVAFSPDGKKFVTGCGAGYLGEARLWDAATGRPLCEPMKHHSSVHSVAFSPDGRLVLTASNDGTACLWDADTGKPLGEPLRHQNAVSVAAFSPDGKKILSVSQDKTARLWDLPRGRLRGTPLPHPVEVGGTGISRDGRILAVTGSKPREGSSKLGGEVLFWDLATGQPLRPPLSFPCAANVLFSPDSKIVLTGTRDGHSGDEGMRARIWDVATGQPLSPPLLHEDWILGADFSPDGKLVATSDGAGEARIWEVPTGKLHAPPMRHKSIVQTLAFTPDGKNILTTSANRPDRANRAGDGISQLWDVATGKPSAPPVKDPWFPNGSRLSPDGKTFVVIRQAEPTAQLFDTAKGQAIGPALKHLGRINLAVFSPDSKTVATGSQDGTARLWEATTGKPLAKPLIHQGPVRSVQFSPDGTMLLTAGDDQTARLWDVHTGLPLGAPMRHRAAVGAAFSRDGRTIVTGSADRTVRLWQVPVPVPGEVERIVRWVEVLTGLELSSEGAVNLLDGPTWQERRQGLIKLGGPPVEASPATGPAWAYDSAVECALQRRWSAALVLLDRHLAAQPQDWLAHVLRTRTQFELGEKQKAADDLARAFELGPRPRVNAWYRIQVAELTGDNRWEQAVWYLDRLIAAQPGDWVLHDLRGRVHAQLGLQDKAEADYARAQQLGPTDSDFFTHWGHEHAWKNQWHQAAADFAQALALGDPDARVGVALALARLQDSDLLGYRQACAEMLQRLGKNDHKNVVYRVVFTCSLLPDTLDNPSLAVALAEKTWAANRDPLDPKAKDEGDMLTMLGMALYRAGRFQEATERLETVLKDRYWIGIPYYLAMAHHRLGHAAEARKYLDQAVQHTETYVKSRPASPGSPSQWEGYVEFQPLRREAEALIEGKTGKSKGSTPGFFDKDRE